MNKDDSKISFILEKKKVFLFDLKNDKFEES